jgi:O-acetyl-ADP-ribose deacetylase
MNHIGRTKLTLLQGDITDQDVDAIVNAANPTLMGGGGVDGAIHGVGGAAIRAACEQIRREKYPKGLPTGAAVITPGGNLKARFVIHTVGPIWSGGSNGEAALLASAYRNSIALAAEEGLHSVAFPSISTGAYGYPKVEAARVAMHTIVDFLSGNDTVREVRFVLFSHEDLRVYTAALREKIGE